ncbi:unnamed protein product [Ixodes hexagonus]
MTSSSSSSSGPTAFPPPAVFLAVPGPSILAWPAWKRAFLSFLDASALHLVEPFRKKAILFLLLGTEGQRIVDAFQLYETVAVEGTDEFQAFLEAVGKYFEFSGSIALERQKLRGLFQHPGQSVTEFLVELRHQASFCALGNALDERLCEDFLEGLESRRVQDRVLQECEGSELPTLSRAIQIARQYEQRAKTAASIRRRESQVPVAAEVQRVQVEERRTAGTQDGGQASSSSIEHGQDGYSGCPPWPQPGYPRRSFDPGCLELLVTCPVFRRGCSSLSEGVSPLRLGLVGSEQTAPAISADAAVMTGRFAWHLKLHVSYAESGDTLQWHVRVVARRRLPSPTIVDRHRYQSRAEVLGEPSLTDSSEETGPTG